MSNEECNYSFYDLYKAAYGHRIPLKEKRELQKLSQDKINDLVMIWAKEAGWKTKKKKGTDKNIYLSFHP
jgi:hypothetical protein